MLSQTVSLQKYKQEIFVSHFPRGSTIFYFLSFLSSHSNLILLSCLPLSNFHTKNQVWLRFFCFPALNLQAICGVVYFSSSLYTTGFGFLPRKKRLCIIFCQSHFSLNFTCRIYCISTNHCKTMHSVFSSLLLLFFNISVAIRTKFLFLIHKTITIG